MIRARAFVTGVAGGLALFASAALLGQTPAQVKEEAKALARSLAPGVKDTAKAGPTPDNLPNYRTGTPTEADLYDDPDNLKARGEAAAPGDPGYQQMRQSMGSRATFAKSELDDVVSRSFAIQNDPNAVVGSYTSGSGNGGCRPLPPSTTGDLGWDETSCNSGVKLEQRAEKCSIRMVANVVNTQRFFYYGAPDKNEGNGFAKNSVMQAKVSAGLCRAEPVTRQLCDAQVDMGGGGDDPAGYVRWCRSRLPGYAQLYSCSAAIPQGEIPYHTNFRTGTSYYKQEGERSVNVARDESGCGVLGSDGRCTADGGEVCVEGPETRTIEGVAVTQQCWRWERGFQCYREAPANDCSNLSTRPGCTFVREECLDDPQDGPCKVSNKVYRCPVPAPPSTEQQYICDGDIYCLNGECETIERTPNNEFGDAVMALNSAADASHQLDPNALTVFKGTRNTCSKVIFGITDCCAPRGFPIVGGGCDGDDRTLKDKREKGLCHYVGTYCSSSVLGICTKKKEAHCCYGSKLARIIQEQGRPQLGLGWGSAKSAKCEGFTVDQFARLDLSRVDFSEVMAEFVEAAKLPDQLQTANDLQTRINNYYATPRP